MTEGTRDLLGKTAARLRDLLTVVAVLAMILSVGWIVTENIRVRSYIARISGVEGLSGRFDTLDTQITSILAGLEHSLATQATLNERVISLEKALIVSDDPVIEFAETGHFIDDGQPGEIVAVQITFTKFRDCGFPLAGMRFIDADGVMHSFMNLSLVDPIGRGPNLPPNPMAMHTLKLTARIPNVERDDQRVAVGRAHGWVEIGSYPDCPRIPVERSPIIPFEINRPTGQ